MGHQFLFIKFVAKRNIYRKLEEARIEYEFDAFVAYHKSDLDWVLNELFENLGDKDVLQSDISQSRFVYVSMTNFIPETQ